MSARTFVRLEAEGVIAASRPGSGRRPSEYDAFTLVPAYLAHRQRKLTGSLESPRDHAYRVQAELGELRLARERRELLPRADVIRTDVTFIKAVTTKVQALPTTLVRRHGEITPENLAEGIREALEEMARWRTELDLLQAVDDEDDA